MRAMRSASTLTWRTWSACCPGGNGAQRQRRRRDAGERMEEIYAGIVAETQATYAESGTALAVPCGEARA